MKEVEKTIGKLIDHQKIAFIGSVDVDGYPNMKAMLTPRNVRGYAPFILRLIHPPCESVNF